MCGFRGRCIVYYCGRSVMNNDNDDNDDALYSFTDTRGWCGFAISGFCGAHPLPSHTICLRVFGCVCVYINEWVWQMIWVVVAHMLIGKLDYNIYMLDWQDLWKCVGHVMLYTRGLCAHDRVFGVNNSIFSYRSA